MSIPSKWVDKIFEKLILHYGRDFTSRWEGLDLNAVKDDWAYELAGFERHPESISYALAHTDSAKPPTVRQFRDLARKAPRPENQQLPPPKASRVAIPEDFKHLASLIKHSAPTGGKDWAHRIIKKAEAGEELSYASVKYAREALNIES